MFEVFEGEAAHAERLGASRRPFESLESVSVEHRAERVEQFVGPGEHRMRPGIPS
jgi:hypothetical protein